MAREIGSEMSPSVKRVIRKQKEQKKNEQKRFCAAAKCAIRGFQQIDGTTETTSIIIITTNDNNKTHIHTAQHNNRSNLLNAMHLERRKKETCKKIVAAKSWACVSVASENQQQFSNR